MHIDGTHHQTNKQPTTQTDRQPRVCGLRCVLRRLHVCKANPAQVDTRSHPLARDQENRFRGGGEQDKVLIAVNVAVLF